MPMNFINSKTVEETWAFYIEKRLLYEKQYDISYYSRGFFLEASE